jgi:hypothetical protein
MISRRIFAALALLCALISPSHAQKTKAQLNTEIGTSFPDAITPQVLRNVTNDIVNSIMPTAPVVSGNVASFNGTTGLLQDSGTPATSLEGIPAVSIESKGGGCAASVADNTSALLDAANSVPGAVRVLFPSVCTYNFTQTNAINFTKPVLLEGAAPAATILAYNPSVDGIFLNWSNGLNVLYGAGGAGISKLTLTSADVTHTKTMVSFSDVSGFSFKDSTVGWPNGFITGGAGSICFYPHGRESAVVSGVSLACDKPIQIGMNPHWYGSQDHFHYSDLFLINGDGFPIITVDPGVVFTNTTFDGMQAWVGGSHGIDYRDTAAAHYVSAVTSPGSGYTPGTPVTLTGGTCSTPITVLPLTVNGSGGILTAAIANPGVCSVFYTNPVSAVSGGAAFNLTLVAGYRLAFSNVRSEGPTSSNYAFNLQPAAQLQGLTITNSIFGPRCGIFLKNTLFATIQNSTYSAGGCGTAVNATSANGNDWLRYSNNFWQTGVTHTVTGMTKVESADSPTGTSAAVPPSALYSSTIANLNANNLTVFQNVASGTFNNVSISSAGDTAALGLGSGKNVQLFSTMSIAAADGAAITMQGTDTYVGRTTTDTLTNKTIAGVNNTLNVRIGADVSGLGAGLQTALTVAVGTAGAPVLFNGAGGTPSSITLTHANGTAASLTAGAATTTNQVGGVDQTTAWTAYTPVLTSEAGGAIGAGNTLTGFWKQEGKTVRVRITIVMGASGMGTATQIAVSLPSTANGFQILVARNQTSGIGGMADIGFVSQTRAVLVTATGATLGGNSQTINVTGVYEQT